MTCFISLQEYKPPASKDIPIDFRIALLKDAPNPIGILGTKGAYLLLTTSCDCFMLKVLASRRCALAAQHCLPSRELLRASVLKSRLPQSSHLVQTTHIMKQLVELVILLQMVQQLLKIPNWLVSWIHRNSTSENQTFLEKLLTLILERCIQ